MKHNITNIVSIKLKDEETRGKREACHLSRCSEFLNAVVQTAAEDCSPTLGHTHSDAPDQGKKG